MRKSYLKTQNLKSQFAIMDIRTSRAFIENIMIKVILPIDIAETCVRSLKGSIKRLEKSIPVYHKDFWLAGTDVEEKLQKESIRIAREDILIKIQSRENALDYMEKYLDRIKE